MSGDVKAMGFGNLGITLAKKLELMRSGHRQEKIEMRLVSHDYRDKFAAVLGCLETVVWEAVGCKEPYYEQVKV